MGHRSHGNEWRTVGGPHALVFLEANQPRQSLVDPGINHGFEPDYGFETGRRARRRPAPEGSQRRGARPRMSWGAGNVLRCARPSSPRPYCSKATILGSLEPNEALPQTDEACGGCGSDRRFMTSFGRTKLR